MAVTSTHKQIDPTFEVPWQAELAGQDTRRIRSTLHTIQDEINHDEGGYQDGIAYLDAVQDELNAARRDWESRMGHQHVWNENDYCNVCGLDGRS